MKVKWQNPHMDTACFEPSINILALIKKLQDMADVDATYQVVIIDDGYRTGIDTFMTDEDAFGVKYLILSGNRI